MGRAPCCDKANVKKGPWSPEEDAKLKSYMEKHGTRSNWIALPQKIGLKRCGKSCRLRWLNYLRPNIKHGGFSEEEDNIICNLYLSIGSRWSIIAAQLPGRTDNDIKNYWNTKLKKKLLGSFSNFHNNPALWTKIHPLQDCPETSNAKGFELDNCSDNLIDSKTAVEADGNGRRGMVQPVSNFKACGYAPQGDKLAQLDGFNNEVINGSKESMIWWSDEFDAKPVLSSNCWGTSTSVVQFNEMFQNFEFGYNV
ncbi:hypothetical protein GQ457_08G002320 [Hibiscus cannabinus]